LDLLSHRLPHRVPHPITRIVIKRQCTVKDSKAHIQPHCSGSSWTWKDVSKCQSGGALSAMKVRSQISSLTCLIPTFCPAKTVLRLIFCRFKQMRPHAITRDSLVVERVVELGQT
jgi:hypothetical protein